MFHHTLIRSISTLRPATRLQAWSSTPQLLRALFFPPAHRLSSPRPIRRLAFSTTKTRFNKPRDTTARPQPTTAYHTVHIPPSSPNIGTQTEGGKGQPEITRESVHKGQNEDGKWIRFWYAARGILICGVFYGFGGVSHKGMESMKAEARMEEKLSILREELTAIRDEWAAFKEEWAAQGLLRSRQDIVVQDEEVEEDGSEGEMVVNKSLSWARTLGEWEFMLTFSQAVGWMVFLCFKGWEAYGDDIAGWL